MRTAVFSAVIISLVCAVSLNVFSQKAAAGSASISFSYKKKSGFASNQFAVWVEDAKGKYVKTLFATDFTADGGWKKRPNSLPLWVKQSGLAEMNKARIDAISGATPRQGALAYHWDGTDDSGAAVSAGKYVIFLEATLRNDNGVIYSAAVKLGSFGEVKPEPKYSGDKESDRDMISDVVVKYGK